MTRILLVTTAALALLFAACKSGPRLEGCDDDPMYYTLVGVSGDLGSLGRSCQLHADELALALHISVPEGTTLAVGNDAWEADEAGIHWLDLKPWLLDLPTSVASSWAEPVDGPIAIPITITESGQSRQGEIRLDVGSVKWSDLLASVADGHTFPSAAENAAPTTLVYVPGSIDDPLFMGQAPRLRDLQLVAVGENAQQSTDTCGPYTPIDPGAGFGFSVTRTVYQRTVTIYDAHTGEQVAQRVFRAAPEPCPDYATEGQSISVRPSEEEVLAWLETTRQGPGGPVAP